MSIFDPDDYSTEDSAYGQEMALFARCQAIDDRRQYMLQQIETMKALPEPLTEVIVALAVEAAVLTLLAIPGKPRALVIQRHIVGPSDVRITWDAEIEDGTPISLTDDEETYWEELERLHELEEDMHMEMTNIIATHAAGYNSNAEDPRTSGNISIDFLGRVNRVTFDAEPVRRRALRNLKKPEH
jgi:hypothetical protein